MKGNSGNNSTRTSSGDLSERSPWLNRLYIPLWLKGKLPRIVAVGLRELKEWVLSREFPRNAEFSWAQEDAEASESISVVVPIHNAPAVTRRCLASLERFAQGAEIIVVDDASHDAETLAAILHYSSGNGWKVVRHEKPLGHSAASEAGASLATRPYVCLLNSDTVVTPWCWRRVKEVFESDQKIGVVGPSTSSSGNIQTLPLALRLCTYWNDSQICAFAGRLLKECYEPTVSDLPWVCGFAFFIRRSLWSELGGFDKNLPDYGNEIDLCRRIVEKGYRTVWVRNAYIHHFGSQSYGDTIGHESIAERVQAAAAYIAQKSAR